MFFTGNFSAKVTALVLNVNRFTVGWPITVLFSINQQCIIDKFQAKANTIGNANCPAVFSPHPIQYKLGPLTKTVNYACN